MATKTELEAIAAARGIDLSGAKSNAERQARIEAASAAGATGSGAAPATAEAPAATPAAPARVARGLVRVRFLERNTHPERGTFEPGDETDVNATRARIWREGGVVEIVGEE